MKDTVAMRDRKLLLINLERLICYMACASGQPFHLLEESTYVYHEVENLDILENNPLIYVSPLALYITVTILERKQDTELESPGFKPKDQHLLAMFS